MKHTHVVWDNFDKVIHFGPGTKKGMLNWMTICRRAFSTVPRPEGVDEIWTVLPVTTPKVARAMAKAVRTRMEKVL